MSTILLITLGLILVAEFINGWTDAPNAAATVVATKVLPPWAAIIIAVIMNVLGALSGTAIAKVIYKDIVDASVITLPMLCAAMTSVIAWGGIAAWKGLPISKSHALLAGLAGAGLAGGGFDALIAKGWKLAGIGILVSIIGGFSTAFFLGRNIRWLALRWRLGMWGERLFRFLQVISASAVAFTHGLNDGQKFMGVFVLALSLGGLQVGNEIPYWVILLCAGVMGLGTSFRGSRILLTLGVKLGDEFHPWQGFASECGAFFMLYLAALAGAPTSTTHTVATSIAGGMVSKHINDVRWNLFGKIMAAWGLTFLFCGSLSFLAAWLTKEGTIAFLTNLFSKYFF